MTGLGRRLALHDRQVVISWLGPGGLQDPLIGIIVQITMFLCC